MRRPEATWKCGEEEGELYGTKFVRMFVCSFVWTNLPRFRAKLRKYASFAWAAPRTNLGRRFTYKGLNTYKSTTWHAPNWKREIAAQYRAHLGNVLHRNLEVSDQFFLALSSFTPSWVVPGSTRIQILAFALASSWFSFEKTIATKGTIDKILDSMLV